jgi:hypothetical protein
MYKLAALLRRNAETDRASDGGSGHEPQSAAPRCQPVLGLKEKSEAALAASQVWMDADPGFEPTTKRTQIGSGRTPQMG